MRDEIIDPGKKLHSYSFPLSGDVQAYIILSDTPDKMGFDRLREFVWGLQKALLGDTAATRDTATGKMTENPNRTAESILEKKRAQEKARTERRKQERAAIPCEKHPESPKHPVSARCVECMREHGLALAARAIAARAEKNGNGNGHEKIDNFEVMSAG